MGKHHRVPPTYGPWRKTPRIRRQPVQLKRAEPMIGTLMQHHEPSALQQLFRRGRRGA